MKVLLVHNHYRHAGGEDAVFRKELDLLRENGVEVVTYTTSTEELLSSSGTFSLVIKTIWNQGTFRQIRALIRQQRPDILHCHNTFPALSPSVYYAARRENVPVVQTLHNYRIACLNAFLFREKGQKGQDAGHHLTCELCVGRFLKFPGVRHRCYHNSVLPSFVICLMLSMHKMWGTWKKRVDRYICLTDFAKDVFIREGLPEAKLSVRPNTLPPLSLKNEARPIPVSDRKGILYVGRLSPEKGADLLLEALIKLRESAPEILRNHPVTFLGDGPQLEELETASKVNSINAVFRGRVSEEDVDSAMTSHALLVLPSVCYEGFPIAMLKAMRSQIPMIVSDIGAMSSIASSEKIAIKFPASDPNELAKSIQRLILSPTIQHKLSKNAYDLFKNRYTDRIGIDSLAGIYATVLNSRKE